MVGNKSKFTGPWRVVRIVSALLLLSLFAGACSSSNSGVATTAPVATLASTVEPILDLRVTGLPDRLGPLADTFSKHVDVWGVNVVATNETNDDKILHAAGVLAQYLDNDGDGIPDNAAVLGAMVSSNATVLMTPTATDFESLDVGAIDSFLGGNGEYLAASQTNPGTGFDAALKQVHHLILTTGWAQVFPNALAPVRGSGIAIAMDAARGGQFDAAPTPYPAGAWFTNNEGTCDYSCMATEYAYWAHTSLLRAHVDRDSEIAEVWRLESPDKVREYDSAVAAILEDPTLGLPVVLPDGNYRLQPSSGQEAIREYLAQATNDG